MKKLHIGTACPVCAGPYLHGEGGSCCVFCGHGAQRSLRRRRPVLPVTAVASRRPRQLAFPLVSR